LVFATAFIFNLTAAVNITVGYGDSFYIRDDFPVTLLVSELKALISQRIRVCTSEIHITDNYRNEEQDKDGWGEFLDHKQLIDYGITENSRGRYVAALRLSQTNNLIPPQQTDMIMAYLDTSSIRVKLDGQMRVAELKRILEIKLEFPSAMQTLSYWYLNEDMNADGGLLLDHKTLDDYGFHTGSKGSILTINIVVPNNFTTGSLIIGYSTFYVQLNIPFNDQDTVFTFKRQLEIITGVAAEDVLIKLYPEPSEQELLDDGVWQDWRILSDYGMKNGQRVVRILLSKEHRVDHSIAYHCPDATTRSETSY